ncbi:MAG TPA: hypothetical protein VIM56_16210 [Rhizomicrobium sp.]
MSMRAEYEAQVRALASLVDHMRKNGAGAETIARAVHAERRALSTHFKSLTPEPTRARIHARTVSVYGDPLGPTIEYLRAQGRTWDEIIESATRPGPLP